MFMSAVDFTSFDPDLGDKCENSIQKKVKGRWCHEACGADAAIIIVFMRSDIDEFRFKICRICLADVAKQAISLLI
jgi:hypothetical protein